MDSQLLGTVNANERINGDVFYSITCGNEDEKCMAGIAIAQVTLAKRGPAYNCHLKSFEYSDYYQHWSEDENVNAPKITQMNIKILMEETTPTVTELMFLRATLRLHEFLVDTLLGA